MNRAQKGIYTLIAGLSLSSLIFTFYTKTYVLPVIDAQLAQEDRYVTEVERAFVDGTLVDCLSNLNTSSPASLQQRVEDLLPIISAYAEPTLALRRFQVSSSLDSQRETLLDAYHSFAETLDQPVSDRSARLLDQRNFYTYAPILPYGLATCFFFLIPFFSSPLEDKSYKQLPLFVLDERTKTYKHHESRR